MIVVVDIDIHAGGRGEAYMPATATCTFHLSGVLKPHDVCLCVCTVLDDMDGVKEQLRQALGSASGMSDQVEAAIQQLYPHATQDQGNT